MSLMDFFLERQIHLKSESAVNVEYISVQSCSELYAAAGNDLLLVKRQLTAEDAQCLRFCSGQCVVFTMPSESLDDHDAKKALGNLQNISLQLIDSIGLSFLHTADTLYVFDREIDTRRKTLTPNAIRISPVLRQDITKIIPVAPSVSAAIGIPQQGQTEPAPLSGAGGQEAVSGAPDPQDPESRELTLLRKKLCELFASRYIEVRVELKGTSPENQTIPLSSFYEKQGIERGHLKGSWSLFEKSIRNEILDSGIVKKARDAVLDEMSVSIPTYGRIIRAGDLEELRAKMEQIAKDYQAYLTGNENCKKVGTLKVEKHFSPADAISESFSKLEAYLYRIGNDLNKGGHYYDAVSEFLNKKRPDPNAFSERVELQLTSSTYTESQWGSRDFLRRFDSAIAESLAVKKTFFDQEIIALTKRCLMLMEEQG